MLMPMTAEDVVVGIFYYMKKHNAPKLTADRETLHRAFHTVSEKHPDVMASFSFRQRELFPESKQLDQALSNLDATGLISRQNLTPRYYLFEDPLVQSYKKSSKKILHAAGINEAKIETVAADIAKLV
ncbi:MAG: hypothetical protein WCW53_03735 [Syntrophales bacterium]